MRDIFSVGIRFSIFSFYSFLFCVYALMKKKSRKVPYTLNEFFLLFNSKIHKIGVLEMYREHYVINHLLFNLFRAICYIYEWMYVMYICRYILYSQTIGRYLMRQFFFKFNTKHSLGQNLAYSKGYFLFNLLCAQRLLFES